jgi:hypothetical protein
MLSITINPNTTTLNGSGAGQLGLSNINGVHAEFTINANTLTDHTDVKFKLAIDVGK